MQKLTKGDIIIFKAEDNWLSKSIAVLSHSDVCHAAMAYSETSIVEVIAGGITLSEVEVHEGSEAYVLRLKSQPDPAPLIQAADKYLKEKIKYDFPGLFLLSGILISHYILPTPKVLTAADHLFDASRLILDNMIQHALKYKGRAMVCSQLIYQIFYDCGAPYRIQVSNGCLWRGHTADEASASIRLLDYIESSADGAQLCGDCDYTADANTDTDTDTKTDIDASVSAPPDTEALAKELYLALSETQHTDTPALQASEPTAELTKTKEKAEKFLSCLQYFLKLIECDVPIDAMFVTPSDILYHSSNLQREGMVSLTRTNREN